MSTPRESNEMWPLAVIVVAMLLAAVADEYIDKSAPCRASTAQVTP